LENFENRSGYKVQDLVNIMERLRKPGGCPWDREQNFESLRKYIIEEAYELVDAISEGDVEKIREECGDLLLQPVFVSSIAKEMGLFDIDDVVQILSEKLVKRHPHVFGDTEVDTSDEVLKNWEKIKIEEKKKHQVSDQSVLSGVPRNLPALAKAYRIQEKAANVGFDWSRDDYETILGKIKEETVELEEEISNGEHSAREEELGDLLFAVVNLARHLDIDPEVALQRACSKFSGRFRKIEHSVSNQERPWSSFSLDELDRMWEKTKTRNKE